MKKHLVAFLSMIGLAGSAAPAQAQVLKGSDQPSKKESQIKQGKQAQENTAAQSKVVDKNAKNAAETNAVNTQIQDKRKDKWAKADAENKAVKTGLENKAAKDQSKLNLKQETLKKQSSATTGQKNALTKAQLTKGALTKAKDTQAK